MLLFFSAGAQFLNTDDRNDSVCLPLNQTGCQEKVSDFISALRVNTTRCPSILQNDLNFSGIHHLMTRLPRREAPKQWTHQIINENSTKYIDNQDEHIPLPLPGNQLQKLFFCPFFDTANIATVRIHRHKKGGFIFPQKVIKAYR